jgi:hypothetical protein
MELDDKRNVSYETKRISSYLERNESPGMQYLSEITPHIFVCNYKMSLDVTILKSYGIKKIVNFGTTKTDATKAEYKSKKIDELTIPIEDNVKANIMEHLDRIYNFIHENIKKKNKMLFHGENGASRPIAFIAYYLLRRYYTINHLNPQLQEDLIDRKKYYLLDIIKFIKMARSCINPNPGFVSQLVLSELALKYEFEPLVIHDIAERERLVRIAEKEKKHTDDNSSDEDTHYAKPEPKTKPDTKPEAKSNTKPEKSAGDQKDASEILSEDDLDKDDLGFASDDESLGLYDD